MAVTVLHVAFVIFLATLIRSAFGFGEALVAVPLLALRIPVTIAAPLAVMMSVTVAGVVIVQDWRHIHFRPARWLVLSSLIGIPFGLLLLTSVNDRAVKIILAAIIIVFSSYSLLRGSRLELKSDRLSWLLGFGFLSGVLGGAYGMNGPPLAIYGSLRRWSPQHFRATLQGYFLPASLMGLLGYGIAGLWGRSVVIYYLLSLPGALVAIYAGRIINRRLRGHAFLIYLHVGLIVVGGVLLAQATGI